MKTVRKIPLNVWIPDVVAVHRNPDSMLSGIQTKQKLSSQKSHQERARDLRFCECLFPAAHAVWAPPVGSFAIVVHVHSCRGVWWTRKRTTSRLKFESAFGVAVARSVCLCAAQPRPFPTPNHVHAACCCLNPACVCSRVVLPCLSQVVALSMLFQGLWGGESQVPARFPPAVMLVCMLSMLLWDGRLRTPLPLRVHAPCVFAVVCESNERNPDTQLSGIRIFRKASKKQAQSGIQTGAQARPVRITDK